MRDQTDTSKNRWRWGLTAGHLEKPVALGADG
jgi:hypothetical protein